MTDGDDDDNDDDGKKMGIMMMIMAVMTRTSPYGVHRWSIRGP